MSDLGRKDLSDKVSEAVTPEQNKSTFQSAKETVTDKADSVAANVTPEDQKSFGQSIQDSIKQGHDDAKDSVNDNSGSLVDAAQPYIDLAKETAANAAQYVSGVLSGGAEGAKKGADSTK